MRSYPGRGARRAHQHLVRNFLTRSCGCVSVYLRATVAGARKQTERPAAGDGIPAGMDAEPAEDAGDVGIDRAPAEEQGLGDLAIGPIGGKEREDLTLPWGQAHSPSATDTLRLRGVAHDRIGDRAHILVTERATGRAGGEAGVAQRGPEAL